MKEPVAIVGMGCRFPGADHPAELWNNILRGERSFETLDQQRWDHGLFYSDSPRAKNQTTCRRAALLSDIDRFADRHFEISPRRARVMDPQQRLLLEVSREALQDAGYEVRSFDRSESSVFFGLSVCEYAGILALPTRLRQLQGGSEISFEPPGLQPHQAYTMVGSLLSMSAAVVAQSFDLGGPSLTLDAACASSLAAVTAACRQLQSLESGEHGAPLALAGGGYLMLHPDNLVAFSKTGALATYDCRPFDREAEGFLIGEGVGVVVLKRLADALADQDRIYAVIRAAEWNNDGRNPSPVMPSRAGQVRLLRRVLEKCGFEPGDLDYVECHGTGTEQGDLTELESLAELLGPESSKKLKLGAMKANIGHTLSAAGIAGLQRAALAIFHRTLPPQAGWDAWPESLMPLADRFEIATRPTAWDGPRRALVNAFGFGGSNCSVAVEASEQTAGEPRAVQQGSGWLFQASAPDPHLLESYLGRLERALFEGVTLGSMASALALRGRLGYGARWRAAELGRCLQILRELRRRLTLEPPTSWQKDKEVELGPEQFADEPGDGQAAGENRLLTARAAVLPPSPLARRSFWCISRLPGPSREPSPEPLTSLPLELGDRLELVTSDHRFLRDHKVSGRPIFPLAVGLDLLCWHAALSPPFALSQVRVGRPWPLAESAQIVFARQRERLVLQQQRPTGRLLEAFSVAVTEPETPPASGALSEVAADLVEFYAGHHLHRQDFRALCRLRPGAAEVLTSHPTWVYPADPRTAWHLDPLVVDGAFQLALMLSRDVLWPVSIEHLALLEPFTGASAEVRLAPDAESPLRADYQFFQDGRLVGWMRGVQARRP